MADFIFSSRYKRARFLRGGQNPVFEKYRKDLGEKRFAKLIYYLKIRGYIKVKSLEGNHALVLSKEGISKAMHVGFVVEDRKKRKDGKWVMLTFDIPQKYVKARTLLRSILKNMGYKMFQQSIWVTPYDIAERTEELLAMHDLEQYVKIFLIQEL